MKIVLTGHSLIHARQQYLGRALADLGHEVLIVAPQRWGNQILQDSQVDCLNNGRLWIRGLPASSQSMYSFRLDGIGYVIKWFSPDVIYFMEEPATMFAQDLFSHRYGSAKIGFHTYENIQPPNKHNLVIDDADFIVAGNTDASKLLEGRKEPDEIMPIAGINTDLFKPVYEEKMYDVLYFGRDVPEKGIDYIKAIHARIVACVWLPHTKYEGMPKKINQCRISVQYPYSTPDWKEQFNSAIAESLACNIPVVASDEAAIKEYYSDCPDCYLIPPKNQEALNRMVDLVLTGDDKKQRGREYVLTHLDNHVIAQRLIKLFEEVA